MKHIILSSSMTTALGLFVCDDEILTVDHCPKYAKARHIGDESIVDKDSKSVLQKKYFRTQCLGTYKDGECLNDLPRLSNKSKGVEQKRIDLQVLEYHKLIAERNINVNIYNTNMALIAFFGQIEIGDDDYSVWLKDEISIFPTVVDYSDFAMVDLELTRDVYNDFFAPGQVRKVSGSCWGSPQYIAKNKPLFSHYIVRNMDKDHILRLNADNTEKVEALITDQVIRLSKDAKFYYIVFGHTSSKSNKKQTRVVKYEWNKKRSSLLDELVSKALDIYMENKVNGWVANPISEICNKCPLECELKDKDIEI